ncbi:carbohydrate ABC transporter permease [Anaerocolumna chitinilytica]|uniref:Sugar ABC transporter permease n=1 Tax=Anaerocolumna chitinilytica TaxID=1727145 RepID=A0A7I8DIT5_9FIRM|nr:carbohydrate ABC transporter permease [Anaerocolumna chitinilytica]BCJ98222.1 sugar ABC transporter permease [Anaerocolumna chitinilytica]
MNKKFSKLSKKDQIILGLGYLLMGLFALAIIVPLIFVIIASFMDPNVLNSKGISFNVAHWSLDGYHRVLENKMIGKGFLNSILYSVSFSMLSVGVTLFAAYPLSKLDLAGRRFFNTFFVITMFFGGGLMPTYLLINKLHMVNTIWAIIVPNAVNVWNIILARTYFQSVPGELREASSVDGASDVLHFYRILMPVCKPIIAVLILWQFVGMWNSYFDAMIYLEDSWLQPLQLVLRSILIQNTPDPGMVADIQSAAEMSKLAELLKYSTIVVSSLPLLIMYPFFQKYFDSGVMVGSIKG